MTQFDGKLTFHDGPDKTRTELVTGEYHLQSDGPGFARVFGILQFSSGNAPIRFTEARLEKNNSKTRTIGAVRIIDGSAMEFVGKREAA
jgi:hypothetical protein